MSAQNKLLAATFLEILSDQHPDQLIEIVRLLKAGTRETMQEMVDDDPELEFDEQDVKDRTIEILEDQFEEFKNQLVKLIQNS